MAEERKLVTVLFADVTGSTALGEELDPEDVRALMGRYYEHAKQVVDNHGGTLEKFIGDAVMAVFGLPHAHGDDAERAVAAGLALQRAVSDDRLLGSVKIRIGLNTGGVVATSDQSRGDFLVTGDAVNVAARLQQSAQPGEVLASERTYGATGAAFLFDDGRDVEVKGKSLPLRVFPVVGARSTRQVDRPPLVGRKQDLLQLALLQARALEERRPQLVSILAPAGTGKTRLLEEFLAGLDPNDGFQVAIARCLPYGQTLTYWPLRGLLESLLGDIGRERVMEAFVASGLGTDDSVRLTDLVLTTLGIETDALAERESIFNAWRLLIEGVARQAPRIIVFEDLHWASDSLLDLVEHLMHPRTQAPLLIIATSRPELLDRRPAWGGGRESFTAVALRPLTENQTAELVQWLGEHLPGAIRQRIVERSGGNPFFATELVRGLAERGIGEEVQASEVVPDTVHGAVLARLDLLSHDERCVLQAASVAGRAFRPATLQAILHDLDLVQIESAIEGLLARDLAAPDEGGAFAFRHILIRDVAYGTLSRSERLRMHAEVAAWLEEYATDRIDEFVELISHHYREAVLLSRRSAVPLPIPFDLHRPVWFLERAGELASRSGAILEARRHLTSAIELAAPEEHIRLYEKLGDSAGWGDASIHAYREALTRWRVEDRENLVLGARLLRKMLMVYMRFQGAVAERPEHEELIAMREEAHRLAEAAVEEDEIWQVRVANLFWPFWRGSVTDEEARHLEATGLAAAAYFEQKEDWQSFSAALDGYSSVAMLVGAHQKEIDASKRRLAAPELPAFERGDATGMVAWASYNLGQYEDAVQVMRDALSQVRKGEPIVHLSQGLAFAVAAAVLHGEWSLLPELAQALDEAWEEVKRDPGAAFLLPGYIPILHVALAREDRAAIDGAIAAVERLASPDRLRTLRPLLAAYQHDDPLKYHHDVDPREIDIHWHTFPWALQFLSERGLRASAALLDAATQQTMVNKFHPHERCIEVATAVASEDPVRLTGAIGALEADGLTPHAARMRIVLAQMTHDSAPLEGARQTLQRLEDRQFLRRLDEVATSLA